MSETENGGKFKISFTPNDQTIEVDLKNAPNGGVGKPGSVLDFAMANNIEIYHVCDGCVACSTCHISVDEGFDALEPLTEDERDQLAITPGRRPNSRLACQCVLKGGRDYKISVIDMSDIGGLAKPL